MGRIGEQMKFVIAPDSFKGTLSSRRVCAVVSDCIRRRVPGAEILAYPIADGGEGTVETFLQMPGWKKLNAECTDPHFLKHAADYAYYEETKTAVIEAAACAGLELDPDRDPECTSTFGVGMMILDAALRGARTVLIGLGGTCTCDGGCGMAAALGVRFLDNEDSPFLPRGGDLTRIAKIDAGAMIPALKKIRFIAMCDVDAPFYGEEGAAQVFAPQKGAGPEAVLRLDEGLRHLDSLFLRDLGITVSKLPGSGAAGGLGGGCTAFLDAGRKSGIDAILDAVGFSPLPEDTDVVITGEGRFDRQTFAGKTPAGVAARAEGRPVYVLCGSAEEEAVKEAAAHGFTGVFPLASTPDRIPEAMAHPADALRRACEELLDTLL